MQAAAPSAPSETTTIFTRAPIISAASAAEPAPVNTSASRCSMKSPVARDAAPGRRPANARASSSPTLT